MILHSYHQPHAALAAQALYRHRIPYLLVPHYHGTGHTPPRQLLHRLWLPIGRGLMRGARTVICVSRAEARLVREDFGRDAVVIPNGTDPVTIPAAADSTTCGARLVLQVGRLEPYKGVERLLRAAAHVSDDPTAPRMRLVVCGEGADRDRLERLSEQLGVLVEFRGRVDDAELVALRQQAHVHTTFSQHEAFGIALADALAWGGNALCTDIPAHREVATLASAEPWWVAADDTDADAGVLLDALRAPRAEPSRLPGWERIADQLEQRL